jgi:Tfp pilus assembly protein PilZ
MFVPSIVAGIAIYAVKKWSYPVFFVSILWITIEIIYYFVPHFKPLTLFFVVILPMLINFLYGSYILLPEVRATYFDPRLRWWETKPRYIYSTRVEINELTGVMTNISEGGLFLFTPHAFDPNTIVNLKFVILDNPIILEAKIVYRNPDGTSHGLQFVNLTKQQKNILKNIIKKLDSEKYAVTRPIPVWTEDLLSWFKTFFKTGKGLVPALPPNYKRVD